MTPQDRAASPFESIRRWFEDSGLPVRALPPSDAADAAPPSRWVVLPYGEGDVALELRLAPQGIGLSVGNWQVLAQHLSVDAGEHGALACGGFAPTQPEQVVALLNALSAHGFVIRASVLRRRIVRTSLLYESTHGRQLPGPDVSAFSFMASVVQRRFAPWRLRPLRLEAGHCGV